MRTTPWWSTALVLLVGAVGAFIAVHFFNEPGSKVIAGVWVAEGVVGLAFSFVNFREAFRDKKAADENTGLTRVYTRENVRREIMRASALLLVVMSGALALVSRGSGELVLGMLLYIPYTISANAGFDTTVRTKLRSARGHARS